MLIRIREQLKKTSLSLSVWSAVKMMSALDRQKIGRNEKIQRLMDEILAELSARKQL